MLRGRDRRGVWLRRAARSWRFPRRPAPGDEEQIDAFVHRAFDIRQDAIADGEDATVGDVDLKRGKTAAGEVVDRGVGLAEIEAFAPISV